MGEGFSYTNSKGVTYYLHQKDVNLKNGLQVTIYFFCRDTRDGWTVMPAGYQVMESTRTGLPLLKKV